MRVWSCAVALLALLVAGPSQAQAALDAPAGQAQVGSLATTLQLIRHRWQLVEATDAHGLRIAALFVADAAPLELDFNASLVSVGRACRVMSAHQRVLADRLEVATFDIAPQSCPVPAQAARDVQIVRRLQGTLRLHFEPGPPLKLVLVNADGDRLVFAGE